VDSVLVDKLGEYEDMSLWQEAADVLFGAGLTLNPSELHGAIAGLMAAGLAVNQEAERDTALALLERCLGVDLHGEVADFTRRVMAATRSAVLDTDFAFTPMMPDDDEPFEHRLMSMARWASGFLTGFTQAVATQEDSGNATIQPTTAEAIKDFAAIAQLDIDEQESDEAARELEELSEYCRMAALNIIQDAFAHQD